MFFFSTKRKIFQKMIKKKIKLIDKIDFYLWSTLTAIMEVSVLVTFKVWLLGVSGK